MFIDGFVIAVPTANKDAFIAQAKSIDAIFIELGATRIYECWGEDVPHGKRTDFYRAVEATEEESVVFSWIEWPDKQTRDAGMAKMMKMAETDERFDPAKCALIFDGKRMIFGGFTPVLTLEK